MKEGILPGIRKLIEVEEKLRAQADSNLLPDVQPAEIRQQKVNWMPPTPEQLREHKKGVGRVYLGQSE